ncbi:hypothetical protein TDB9533_01191 [Thalassocella blandensis]|nr:hypothetical protein TDB9533_01191 [Thalassocella blandensis]
MLHILSQPNSQLFHQCIESSSQGDSLVLIAEACDSLLSSESFAREVLLATKHLSVYHVQPSLSTSGQHTAAERLATPTQHNLDLTPIKTIDYPCFVSLANEADKVLSWY